MANENNREQYGQSQIDSLIQMNDLEELLLKAMGQRNLGHSLRGRVPHMDYGDAWNQGAALTPYSTTVSNVESREAASEGEFLDILYQALSGKTGYTQQQVPFKDDAGSLRPGNILDIVTQLIEMSNMKKMK